MATKEEILKALNEASTEDRTAALAEILSSVDDSILAPVLDQVNRRGTRLVSQQELEDKILPERLAKFGRNTVKREEYESLQAEHDRLKSELEKRATKKDPQLEQQYQKQMDELNKRIDALIAESDAEKARADSKEKELRATISRNQLRDVLLKNGAHPQYIDHATHNAGRDLKAFLQLAENNGDLCLTAMDPTKGRSLDLNEVVAGWLDKNDLYKQAASGGGGLPSGTPTKSPPGKDPMTGMTGQQRMDYAVRHSDKFGRPPPDTDGLPTIGGPTPSQGGTD